MPMDALDQHPKGLELLAGLRRLGRLILTDQRGIEALVRGIKF